jgi:hypothetical protein
VEKWDGVAPLVVGSREGLVYQMQDLQRLRELNQNVTSPQSTPAAAQ